MIAGSRREPHKVSPYADQAGRSMRGSSEANTFIFISDRRLEFDTGGFRSLCIPYQNLFRDVLIVFLPF